VLRRISLAVAKHHNNGVMATHLLHEQRLNFLGLLVQKVRFTGTKVHKLTQETLGGSSR
jgi:hypothetical protein